MWTNIGIATDKTVQGLAPLCDSLHPFHFCNINNIMSPVKFVSLDFHLLSQPHPLSFSFLRLVVVVAEFLLKSIFCDFCMCF